MRWFIFVLKSFSKVEGRAARREYWYFILVTLALFIVLSLIDGLLGTWSPAAGMGVLGGILCIVLAIPSITVGARRLHDTGRSGWWQLVNFIPYIGPLVLLVLMSLRGTAGENAYGPPPQYDA